MRAAERALLIEMAKQLDYLRWNATSDRTYDSWTRQSRMWAAIDAVEKEVRDGSNAR